MQGGWRCLLGLGQCPVTSVYRAGSTVLNSRLFKSLWVYAKSLQLCLTLCDPMDCGLPGSSVHGDSPGKNTGMDCHALLQGNLPNPGTEPVTLEVRDLAGGFFTASVPPEKPH